MIEKTADVSMWMLLAVCLGFLIGELCGNMPVTRSACSGKMTSSVTGSRPQQPTASRSSAPSRNSGVSSTTSTAVLWLFQKASKNAPRNSHQIKGRISPIRPFKKV